MSDRFLCHHRDLPRTLRQNRQDCRLGRFVRLGHRGVVSLAASLCNPPVIPHHRRTPGTCGLDQDIFKTGGFQVDHGQH